MITGQFNVTGAGFSGTAPIGVALYKYSPTANIAWLFLPAITGVSNSTSFSISPLPSFLIPATIATQQCLVEGFDNGTEQGPLNAVISAGSNILVYQKNGSSTGWTASGNKGIGLQVITFFLN